MHAAEGTFLFLRESANLVTVLNFVMLNNREGLLLGRICELFG